MDSGITSSIWGVKEGNSKHLWGDFSSEDGIDNNMLHISVGGAITWCITNNYKVYFRIGCITTPMHEY